MLKVYRTKRHSSWPYTEVIDVKVAMPDWPIELHTDYDVAGNRVYRQHPENYVEWALMVEDWFYGDVDYAALGANEIEDVGEDVWVHLEFMLFNSLRKSDDKTLNQIRELLKKNGIAALDVPKEIAVADFFIDNDTDTRTELKHPLGDKQVNGSFKKERGSQFYISDTANSRLPIINEGSIPEECADDFGFVYAGVVRFEPMTAIPTHAELLSELDRHLKWFQALLEPSEEAK